MALAVPKNAEALGGDDSQFFFCVDKPTDLNFFRRGGAYLIPLYLYRHPQDKLFDPERAERSANFSPNFLADVRSKIGARSAAPADIFAYIYAVLYSPGYRARYDAFLKRDFPRLPLTSDARLFKKLVVFGQRLIDVHLLRAVSAPLPDYPVAGNNRVDKVEFKNGRVYINAEQYFDAVGDSTWNYQIGGYQVAHKWLKDRKGRLLTFDDLQHYRNVIAALTETIRVQHEIDALIPGWPLK